MKTEGDAFMVAFQEVQDALEWCVNVQERLMALPWPEDIVKQTKRVDADNGQIIFNGVRVRMGIFTGQPKCRIDPITGTSLSLYIYI